MMAPPRSHTACPVVILTLFLLFAPGLAAAQAAEADSATDPLNEAVSVRSEANVEGVASQQRIDAASAETALNNTKKGRIGLR